MVGNVESCNQVRQRLISLLDVRGVSEAGSLSLYVHLLHIYSFFSSAFNFHYEICSVVFVSHGDTLQILSTIFQRIGAGQHRSVQHIETAVPRELGEWNEEMRNMI